MERNRTYEDIVFHNLYAKLYEEKENGKAQTFLFRNQYGAVEHTFIKRKIPYVINGDDYYDITTAYGYGGPILRDVKDTDRLLDSYYTAFQQYCLTNRIVSEFIRFHLFENIEVRKRYYGDVAVIGPHVSRNLTKPLSSDIHKSVRTSLRKADSMGLTFSADDSEAGLKDFLSVYNATMDRHDADSFYYFKESFFQQLHEWLEGHYIYTKAIVDGKVVSSFITLFGKSHAFGFLGGTLEDYFDSQASTFLEWHTMEWLKKEGLTHYTIGGGIKGEDGLFKYKSKFDKQGIHPFYVGKKIHNKQVYDYLVNQRLKEKNFNARSDFFPLYRQ
ncbi:GNAT family N-acetyltransferase [Alkalibacterium pelagium]|nr:GNAT family N-acetyltransferase [Alkalibacterium pelagium]